MPERAAGKRGAAAGAALADRRRLDALAATGVMDSRRVAELDRLTRLATALLGTSVSLISLVDDKRQFFRSQTGLAEPWASARQTPLTHSLCQHVVTSGDMLVVDDAREHEDLRNSSAIEALGAVAYLGVPLTTAGGEILGSFCAIDPQPREWSDEDIETVQELASAAATMIDLRARLARNDEIDALTGLVTRERLLHEIEAAISACTHHGGDASLLAIDITRLSLVNESLGRRGGDQLIAAVGARLHDLMPEHLAARVTGSQLAILCSQAGGEHRALVVADSVRALLREPFLVDGLSLHSEVSIGIAVSERGDSPEELLDRGACGRPPSEGCTGHGAFAG